MKMTSEKLKEIEEVTKDWEQRLQTLYDMNVAPDSRKYINTLNKYLEQKNIYLEAKRVFNKERGKTI